MAPLREKITPSNGCVLKTVIGVRHVAEWWTLCTAHKSGHLCRNLCTIYFEKSSITKWKTVNRVVINTKGVFFNIPGSIDSDGGTAYFAHIGGFLAGIVLIPFFKNKNVQLFHEKNTSSWQVFERGSNEFNFKKKNDVVIDFIKKSEESINRRKHWDYF